MHAPTFSNETPQKPPPKSGNAPRKQGVLLLRCSPKDRKRGLPATAEEIKSVGEIWRKKESSTTTIQTLSSGSPLDLLRELSPNVTVLHVASHMDDRSLGDETVLFVDEAGIEYILPSKDMVELVATRKDSLELVVLNGCSSEKMALALAREGVRCVVGWRTSVNDDAAKYFARGLHIAWAQGDAPAIAFERAKRSVASATFAPPLKGFERKEINRYVLMDPNSKAIELDPERGWIVKPRTFELLYRTPAGVPVIFRSKRCADRRCAPPRDLVGRGFVGGLREEDVRAVTRMVCGGRGVDADTSVTTSKITTKVGVHGVKGMGGLGKSTLAQQLCHKVAKIRRRFGYGGIFWLTASATSVLEELKKLLHDLLALHVPDADAKEETARCAIEKDALDAIRKVFETRWPRSDRASVLIVLDDVWEASRVEQLVPIDALPRGSAVLMTYRRRQIGFDVRASSYALEGLTKASARALFESKSGVCLEEENDGAVVRLVDAIVRRLGMHPMALAIVGRLARRRLEGQSRDVAGVLTEVIEELREGYLGEKEEEEEEEEDAKNEETCEDVGEAWIRSFLTSNGLERFVDAFLQVGCDSRDSAWNDLDEETLMKMDGMKELNARRILRLLCNDKMEETKRRQEREAKARDREERRRARERERRHKCVRACIGMSVNSLESTRAKSLLLSLAVFAEDTSVPSGVLEAAFGDGGGRAGSLRRDLDDLVDACVLEREEPGSGAVLYRLHDLCRDYVVGETKARLGKMQIRFVESFKDAQDDDLPLETWRNGRECPRKEGVDDFVADRLCWHLRDAATRGERKRAETMLARIGRSVSWMETRLRRHGVGATLRDLEHVRAAGPKEGRWQVELVRSAIGMSSHVLAKAPERLAEHLWQRLVLHAREETTAAAGMKPYSSITSLEERARRAALRHWLGTDGPVERRRRELGLCWMGRAPRMKPAGGPLLRTLAGHEKDVKCATTLVDPGSVEIFGGCGVYVVSGEGGYGGDKKIRIWEPLTGRCVRTLKGHTSAVTSLATLTIARVEGEATKTNDDARGDDRVLVVSASWDKTIRVWNPRREEMVRTIQGDGMGKVHSVAVLEDHAGRLRRKWIEAGVRAKAGDDNSFVVSGSSDKAIRVWNLRTAAVMRTMRGHGRDVTSVAVLYDTVSGAGNDAADAFVVSGSLDNTIRLWNPRTGEMIRVVGKHESSVHSVAVLSRGAALFLGESGPMVVSGSADNAIRLWNPHAGKAIRVVGRHTHRVTSVAVVPRGAALASGVSGPLVVSGSVDKSIRVWNTRTGKEIGNGLCGHTDRVSFVAILSDPSAVDLLRRALSSSRALRDGVGIERRIGDDSIKIERDAPFVVSASPDGTVRLWDPSKREITTPSRAHTSSVLSLAILRDPRGRLRRAPAASKTRLVGRGSDDARTSNDDDDVFVVSGSWDGTIQVRDARTGEVVRTMQGDGMGEVHCVAVLEDRAGRLRRKWIKEGILPKTVDDDADDAFVVSGSGDDAIRVWNPRTSEVMRTMRGHEKRVTSVAVLYNTASSSSSAAAATKLDNDDDVFVVSGGSDHTIRLWSPRTGKAIRVLRTHENGVTSVAVLNHGGGGSDDVPRVVSGSYDQTIRLWHSPTACDAKSHVSRLFGSLPFAWFRKSSAGRDVKESSSSTVSVLKGHADLVLAVAALAAPAGRRLRRALKAFGSLTRRDEDDDDRDADCDDDGFVVSGSQDNTLRLWDLRTRRAVVVCESQSSSVLTVAFVLDPFGRLRRDLLALQLSPSSPSAVPPGCPHRDPGVFLVSGSSDNTLRLWDPLTGRCAYTHVFDTSVRSVAVWPPSKTTKATEVRKASTETSIAAATKFTDTTTADDALFTVSVGLRNGTVASLRWYATADDAASS